MDRKIYCAVHSVALFFCLTYEGSHIGFKKTLFDTILRPSIPISISTAPPSLPSHQVWYHTCGSKSCTNSRLDSEGGCTIWQDESDLLTEGRSDLRHSDSPHPPPSRPFYLFERTFLSSPPLSLALRDRPHCTRLYSLFTLLSVLFIVTISHILPFTACTCTCTCTPIRYLHSATQCSRSSSLTSALCPPLHFDDVTPSSRHTPLLISFYSLISDSTLCPSLVFSSLLSTSIYSPSLLFSPLTHYPPHLYSSPSQWSGD